ncbi:hypothetical protein [uncultured Prevotella sp.]|uniref:hypothetical protein n=1 Tax=uncultured Prevotella sp. TaxID=159272 RepID=UPI0025D9102B|nr:hypothetical protein [uncultured Prevotella sp.]
MEKIIITTEKQIMLDGLLTLGMLENGLKTADFMCCEDVEMQAFSGTFKVEIKRDGNVYMTEKPKRIRNKALFRDDNASLSQGQDKRWYFYFSLDEDQLEQLPEKLVRQAGAIARKVIRELILKQQAV